MKLWIECSMSARLLKTKKNFISWLLRQFMLYAKWLLFSERRHQSGKFIKTLFNYRKRLNAGIGIKLKLLKAKNLYMYVVIISVVKFC